ncbi:MAG TPA: PH domain-containing protein [Candidatus Peribacterales bacterium]|nr:PH domain-containing protein [Candidatus Peribacterales bacterium]
MLERLFHRHLEDDEPMYLLVHKHWMLSFVELALPLLALLGSWVLLYMAPIKPVFVTIFLVDIVILFWGMRNFLDYYLDALLITDRAVIDIEWHGWFHRESTRIDYSSIEGVSYEVQGILGTILNYGTITIERIGNGSVVEIEKVKRPRDVESAILACQSECLRTKNLKDSAQVKDIIAEIVAERMQMKALDQDEGQSIAKNHQAES